MTRSPGELSSARPTVRSGCDYCGLPLPSSLWGTAAGEPDGPRYCCVGCRVAAAVTQEKGDAGAARWTLVKLGFAGFFAMNVMMFTMVLWSEDVYGPTEHTRLSETLTGIFRYLAMAFAAPVLFLLGRPLLENAAEGLKRRVLSTDLLLLSGVVASYLYSAISVLRGHGHIYFEVGCVILILVMVGRWLEAAGRVRANESLDALERLLPDQVRTIRGGRELLIPREELKLGDRIRILPGDRIPSDGRIVKGTTAVDEQLVTGESRPAHKSAGAAVFGGTLNVEGAVIIELTAAASEGTVQRLIRAVNEARAQKGRYERLAERVSAWFFLVVTPLTVVAFAWHTVKSGVDQGILSGLAVVLIACPCALALATPLAVWTALARAAGEQIVLKGGDSLERLARVKVLCLDKTGTLTTGRPRVVEFVVDDPGREWEILAAASAVARSSNHVFATAITDFADGCPSPGVIESRVVAGRGVLARLQNLADWVYLGSLHFIDEAGLAVDRKFRHAYDEAVEEGRSVAFVGWNGRVQAAFVFDETVRPGTNVLLEGCASAGLQCTVLTGDHQQRARALQTELGVPVAAELLPEEKVCRIRELQRRIGPVAMVGDGINDAPALAAADVGIALGCGADVSRDSADVCLMGNDLSRLPWLFGLARATVRTIRFNLCWAFVYNIIGIGLALTGRLNPIVAALCMVASSVCVLTNSLRLRRFNLNPSLTPRPSNQTTGSLSDGAAGERIVVANGLGSAAVGVAAEAVK
jgi:heavy metal translocating P-type ATPase